MSKSIKLIICPYCNSTDTYIKKTFDVLGFCCGECKKYFYSEDLNNCMQLDDDMSPLYDGKTQFINKYEDIDGMNYTIFTTFSDSGDLINMLMEEKLEREVNYKKLAFYSFMDNNL